MKNPYAGKSREELKAIRRDLLNGRTGHLRESERLLAESRRVLVAMSSAETEQIGVTDHAVIRWLERVQGVDTVAVRQEIKRAIAEGDKVGDSFLVPSRGVRIVVHSNRVTTILPEAHEVQATSDKGEE